MQSEYQHNHYVPEWYQKRFLAGGQTRHHYLDLRPDKVTTNGHTYHRKAELYWGPKRCFAQDDLYTTKWGGLNNREIEKFFFGPIDSAGKKAVEHFADFKFTNGTRDAWNDLVQYISVQKLRTPKGLKWLKQVTQSSDRNDTLIQLQRLRNIFCNIFAEAVWQIADA